MSLIQDALYRLDLVRCILALADGTFSLGDMAEKLNASLLDLLSVSLQLEEKGLVTFAAPQ